MKLSKHTRDRTYKYAIRLWTQILSSQLIFLDDYIDKLRNFAELFREGRYYVYLLYKILIIFWFADTIFVYQILNCIDKFAFYRNVTILHSFKINANVTHK